MAEEYGDYFEEEAPRSAPVRRRRRRAVSKPKRDTRTWVPPWYKPEPFTPGWNKRGLPPCTDTVGEPIKRVGFASLQREMNSPRDLSCETHAMEYAHVHCESLGLSLMRLGVRVEKAKFWVCTHNGFEREFEGAAGRDAAVKFFLKLLKKRRHYYYARKAQHGDEN